MIGNVISGDALTAYAKLHGNPCRFDPTTDAIVPFQITTTNTTFGDLTASGDQELEIVNASLGVAPNGSDSAKGAQDTQSNAGFAAGEVLKAVEISSSGVEVLQSRSAWRNDDHWQRLTDERSGLNTQWILRT